MKNIIILILALLLGFVVYTYILKDQNESVVSDNSDGAIVTGNNNDQNTDTPPENPTNDNTQPNTQEDSTAQASSTSTSAYCQDLKDAVSGSAPYVIMTGLADSSSIANGDELSGCVYAPNGSYAGWAPFEAQVGVYVVQADDGTVLGQGPLSVTDTLDWMNLAMANQDIQYSTAMDFDPTGYTNGTVTLRNANPSGEPSMDKTVTISVTF